MSFSGSGVFNINSAGQPVVSGTVISSSVFNALTADLATGLSTCITKDGQTTVTANIPMNSYKITGLAAGTAATDAARVGQLQAGSASVVTVAGTDTYTGTMSPSLAAYAAGNTFTFVVPNTNTTASTLNIDGLGAKALTRDGSTALVAGDLVANAEVVVVYDGTRFQVLNSNSKTNFNLSGTLTVAGNTTLSGGTANGVAYLNGSKVLTSGTALTFDGTILTNTSGAIRASGSVVPSAGAGVELLYGASGVGIGTILSYNRAGSSYQPLWVDGSYQAYFVSGTEGMRLTSTGLGIGTSSPSYKLVVSNAGAQGFEFDPSTGLMQVYNRSTSAYGEFRPYGSLMRFYTGTSPTETMRLDSSGNLGIGTSSPSNPLTVTSDTSAQVRIGTVSANIDARLTMAATGTGRNVIGTTGVGPLAFLSSSTEQMRLDTSGNLGIGVTPSAWVSYQRGVDFGGGGNYGSLSSRADFVMLGSNCYLDSSGTTWRYKNTAAASYLVQSGGAYAWYSAGSGTAGNAITFTQAMTLDSSGNLLVGTTGLPLSNGRISSSTPNTNALRAYISGTSQLATAAGVFEKADNNTTTSNVFVQFTINAQATGSGQINANGANAAAFGSFSDRRLKENIVNLPPQLANIMALRPVEFDYIESEGGGHQISFIAQEFEQVYPDAVGKRADGMLTITGWSKTEARLVKAMQEQQALIESLTARLNALENK